LLTGVSTRVLSYYTNWSYFIAEYASDRYNIRLSCSDLTVQHLAEYFAHRGGKGNLGRVLTAKTCAKLSKAMMGKKHTLESRAKMSMAKTGTKRKKHTLESRAKLSKAMMGKKHTLESRAKMSMAKTGKKPKKP
jgi:hypothetical protein